MTRCQLARPWRRQVLLAAGLLCLLTNGLPAHAESAPGKTRWVPIGRHPVTWVEVLVGAPLPAGSSCTTNVPCASRRCRGGICMGATGDVCAEDVHCQSGICKRGTCRMPNGAVCVAANECQSGLCVDETCGLPNGADCTSDASCASGTCAAGQCGHPCGSSCSQGIECAGGVCADGVCGGSSCSSHSNTAPVLDARAIEGLRTTDDAPIIVGLPVTDADGNLDLSTLAVTAQPSQGTASIGLETPSLVYTPERGTSGMQTFGFSICDTAGLCVTDTVSVRVNKAVDAGAIAGAFSVDQTGSAVYRIPIAVPPGTGGATPTIALTHRSFSGFGTAGTDWHLEAFSSIHRCFGERDLGEHVKPINLADSDTLCLDGRRLVRVSPESGSVSGTTIADYVEYRLDNDIASVKVVGIGRLGRAGPEHFRVWDGTGGVREYGATEDSRLLGTYAFPVAGGLIAAGPVFKWSINRHYDTAGNYVDYSYDQRSNPDTHARDQVLSRIDYSANDDAALEPFARVDFGYIDSPAPYRNNRCISGANFGSSRVLDRVTVRYGDAVVRQYRLDYQVMGIYPRLTSIEQCEGSEDDAPCLPATGVTWAHGSSQYEPASIQVARDAWPWRSNTTNRKLRFADVDADGDTDLVEIDGDGVWVRLASPDMTNTQPALWAGSEWHDRDTRLADYDGDGRADLVGFGPTGVFVALSVGTQFVLTVDNLYSTYGDDNLDDEPRYVLDLNADGRADIATFYEGRLHAVLSSVGGRSDETHEIGDTQRWSSRNNQRVFADVNGDGVQDAVLFSNNGIYVAKGQQDGATFGSEKQWNEKNTLPYDVAIDCDVFCTSYSVLGYGRPYFMADVTGDGLADAVGFTSSGPRVLVSTGINFHRLDNWTLAPPAEISDAWEPYRPKYPADFNGDGLADVVLIDGRALHVAFSTGNGFEPFRRIEIHGSDGVPVGVYPKDTHIRDFNGDGMPDVAVVARTIVPDPHVHFVLSETERAHVKRINVPDRRISIDVSSLLDGEVYKATSTSTYPFRTLMGGARRVVSSTDVDNGIGGLNTQNYEYENLVVHVAGKGMMGFGRVTVSSDARVQITDYAQQPPLNGRPVREQTFAADGSSLLRDADYTHELISCTVGSVQNGVIRLVDMREQSYEPTSGHLIGSNSVSLEDFDVVANAATVRRSVDNGVRNTDITETLVYETWSEVPSDDDDRSSAVWRPSVLKSKTTTATVPGYGYDYDPYTRQLDFEYDPSTGLPSAVVADPGDTHEFRRSVEDFDSFGNATLLRESWTTDAAIGLPATYRETSHGYDPTGRFRVTETNAAGHVVRRSFDGATGLMLGSSGPSSSAGTEIRYTKSGRKSSEYVAGGHSRSWTIARDTWTSCPMWTRRKVEERSPQHKRRTIACLDAYGRQVRRVWWDALDEMVLVDYRYDSLGRLEGETLPYFAGDAKAWVTRHYDGVGRVERIDFPNGESKSFDYYSLVVSETDENGFTTNRTYASDGKIVAVRDPLGRIAHYEYDAAGNQIGATFRSRRRGPRESMEFGYDLLGRRTSVVDPNMGTWTYQYNALGGVYFEEGPASQVVHREFDILGRTTAELSQYSSREWFYDGTANAIGRPSYAIADDIMDAYAYDAFGRVVRHVRTTSMDGAIEPLATSRSYDAFGRLARTVYPSGLSIGRTFSDWNGAPVRTYDIETNATYWKIERTDAFGNLTEYSTGAIERTRTFEPLTGRLAAIVDSGPAGSIIDLGYEYDDVGNVNLQRDDYSGNAWRYGYDDAGQLSWLRDENTGTVQDITYDNFGNVQRKPGTDAQLSYTGTRLDRIDGDDGIATVPVYDASGQITTVGDRTVEYGEFGQPVAIAQEESGNRVSLRYDADGAVAVADVDVAQNFPGPSGQYVSVSNEYQRVTIGDSQEVLHRHFIGEDVLVVVSQSGTRVYNLHRDRLGSLHAVSDEGGVVLSRQRFDAWGVPTTLMTSGMADIDVGQTCSMGAGFTGHMPLAAVGLVHMKARVYDPLLGRFLSPDSIIPGNLPIAFNRYAYAFNSPLFYIDPTGHFPWGAAIRTAVGLGKLTAGVLMCVGTVGGGCGAGVILILLAFDDLSSGIPSLVTGEPTPSVMERGWTEVCDRAGAGEHSAACGTAMTSLTHMVGSAVAGGISVGAGGGAAGGGVSASGGAGPMSLVWTVAEGATKGQVASGIAGMAGSLGAGIAAQMGSKTSGADGGRSEYPPGRRFQFNSKKKAYEAAKRAGGGKEPIHHAHGEHGPHYHPNVKQPQNPTPHSPGPHDHYYYGGG